MGPYHPVIEELIKTSQETTTLIYFLLTIPLIFLIQNIFRYFLGIKNLNVYSTLSLTYLLYSLSGSEEIITRNPNILYAIISGIIALITITLAISFTYKLLAKIQLHFYPKITLVLFSTTLTTFLLLIIAQKTNNLSILQINPLNIILLHIIAEQIFSIYTKSGLKATIKTLLDGFVISSLALGLITNFDVRTFMLNYPWIVLFCIPLNLFIGRYTGLRINEYIRFSGILKSNVQTNENSSDNQK